MEKCEEEENNNKEMLIFGISISVVCVMQIAIYAAEKFGFVPQGAFLNSFFVNGVVTLVLTIVFILTKAIQATIDMMGSSEEEE